MPTTNPETALRAYRCGQVLNAPPLELVDLFYRKAIAELRRAIEASPTFGEHVRRAQAVVSELRQVLDDEQGGHIAGDLDRLYEYVLWCLSESIRLGGAAPLEDALSILCTLREAWEAIVAMEG